MLLQVDLALQVLEEVAAVLEEGQRLVLVLLDRGLEHRQLLQPLLRYHAQWRSSCSAF